ncbi:hypothetical protein Hanom_Chr02g00144631 [Helianthus anomalus]
MILTLLPLISEEFQMAKVMAPTVGKPRSATLPSTLVKTVTFYGSHDFDNRRRSWRLREIFISLDI